MPELPEVETVRNNLAGVLIGATIARVETGDYLPTIQAMTPEAFSAGVAGQTVSGVGRRAKLLLLELTSGDTVSIHLRMTGELSIVPVGHPRTPHFRLGLVLDDGRELRFTDVRKFGRVRLRRPAELAELDQAYGPEPLDPVLTGHDFWQRLSGRKRAIKPLLLDQAFIAGVGNIYADEALFIAGIHPLRASSSLSETEAQRLLTALRDTLSGAIERGGSSIRDYRNGLGGLGTNQNYLRIYALAAGTPCPRCGTPVERLVVGQRGTKFCPACQPLPHPGD